MKPLNELFDLRPAINEELNLNRANFDFDINVPSILIDTNIKIDLKVLKAIMLKLPNLINPLKTDKHCLFLLDPLYSEKLKKKELSQEFENEFYRYSIMPFKISINYLNWKWEEIFKALIPNEDVVSSFSQIGHIIHLNLKDKQLKYKYLIGKVLIDKVKNAETVLNKKENISSKFRNIDYEVIAGKPDTKVEVHENGCTFEFDFAEVFWNPRLGTEHLRVIELLTPQDILFDPMAGVGPFAIPAAKRANCHHVFANDLNPQAVSYLLRSAIRNKIKQPKSLTVTCLDASIFIKDHLSLLLKQLLNSTSVEDAQAYINMTNNHANLHTSSQNIQNPEPAMTLLTADKAYNFIGDIHIPMNLPGLAIKFIPDFCNILKDFKYTSKLKGDPKFSIFIHLYMFVKAYYEEGAVEAARKAILTHEGIVCDGESNVYIDESLQGKTNLSDVEGAEKIITQMDPPKSDRPYKRLKPDEDTKNLETLELVDFNVKPENITEIYMVRKVSPGKHMIRVSFKMPWSYMGLSTNNGLSI